MHLYKTAHKDEQPHQPSSPHRRRRRRRALINDVSHSFHALLVS
jgi:hypothetical protein